MTFLPCPFTGDEGAQGYILVAGSVETDPPPPPPPTDLLLVNQAFTLALSRTVK